MVYNHTAEGNHLGPDAQLPRHRQPHLLPAGRRRPALLHGLHRHRQHASTCATRRCCKLIMDSLRYWVHGDARRRLPLRPGRRRSRASCTTSTASRAFFDIIHQDPVHLAGQADRRAVGRRRGRLPGRQLPGPLGGVERQVPRRGAPLLEGRRRASSPSSATGSPGQQRPLPATTAASPTPASTSSPRTTASRCTTWSATTRSTTRPTARTTATAPTTTTRWNCGVEGPTDDPAIIDAARAAEAQLPGDAALLAGRADDLRRRRDRPHPARQQQRLLPGQRDQLVRLEPRRAPAARCSSSPAALIALRQRAPDPAPAQVLPGPAASAAPSVKDIAWLRARRRAR